MKKLTFVLLLLGVLVAGPQVRADDVTRQVQEELRNRNLFHGDIDGRQSPGLVAALKLYQERKGFTPSGEIDADTLRSMSITDANESSALPNVPVLRSDRAMEAAGERDAASLIAMPESVEGPPATREEMQAFVRRFLDAAETAAVNDQLKFYAPRVEYFDHGAVTRTYIRNELVAYSQQWPLRQYSLGEKFTLERQGFQTLVQYRVRFQLRNPEQNRAAAGETKNTLVLTRQPDLEWQIVAHREERVRNQPQSSEKKARRRPRAKPRDPLANTLRKVGRTLRKVFR